MVNKKELELQEQFSWARQSAFATYNKILGFYQAVDIITNKHGDTLLDMPCGDGYITAMMAKHFKKTVALDASSEHLKIAKKTAPEAEFYHSLIEDFEYKDKFDTITMINVIEHVEDPIAILKKAKSLMANNGIVCIHAPNAHAVNRKISSIMGSLESCEELSPFDINIAGHRRSYTMDTLVQDITNAGLKIVLKTGIFYKMLSTAQMDCLLTQSAWEEGGFGWGRVGSEKAKDWRAEFCRACYEFGKERPEDCNILAVYATK